MKKKDIMHIFSGKKTPGATEIPFPGIKISGLIFSFFLFQISVFSQSDTAGSQFIQNEKVKFLAQKFDSIYFPLFLKSFDWIRNNDSSRIREYYYPDILKKSGGYSIDISDYSKLKVTPVYKFRNVAVTNYTVNFPVDWSDTIQQDPSWRLWFHSLAWLEPYMRSTNPDSVTASFCVINDWISAHLNYPVATEQFAFDDHAVSERLVMLMRANTIYHQCNYNDKQFESRLLLSILNHIFFVSTLEKYLCWHNHAIIFDERLITTLEGMKEFRLRDEFFQLAYSRVFEQYRYSFSNEGIHKEQSPCYHYIITSKLNSIIAFAREFNIPVPDEISAICEKANDYNRYIALNGINLAIGDCFRYPVTISDSLYNDISAQKSFTLVPNQKMIEKQSECKLSSKVFPLTGWAYIFDTINKLSIVAQSDFFGLIHYHQDETSFIITADNHELILDPGLYSYLESPVNEYYRSVRAHNLLMIDSSEFELDLNNTGLAGITRFYKDSSNFNTSNTIIEMTHPHYCKIGSELFRQFIFPGGHEMIIKDIVNSAEPHTYNQLFHLGQNAVVTRSDSGFFVTWPDHPYTLKIKSNEENYRIISGQKNPLQGWYFPKFREIAEAPVLILQKKGAQCEFITRISIGIPGCPGISEYDMDQNVKLLLSKIETVKRKDLVHLSFPERWKHMKR